MATFNQESYDMWNVPGVDAVEKYFKTIGYHSTRTVKDKEDFDIDITLTREGVKTLYVEVAVREPFVWDLWEWDKYSPWKTVHILKRKAKYGKEPFGCYRRYGEAAFLFECSVNLKQAMVIRPYDILKRDYPLSKKLSKFGWDWIYDVPYNDFKVIDLCT